ncbi:MAG: succinate dehydrogenase, cytochrome b556 subunit [Pseudomonadota bacterium]
MIRPRRGHPLWYAFVLHRISGLLLALFLPAHFWVLSQALNDPSVLDGILEWTEMTVVKLAEFGLVFLLAVHFFGGMRLLALEFLPWTPQHKTLAAGAVGLSVLVSGTFLLQAI